jgi:tight adherence protein B
VRIFTVGLRSQRFQPAALRQLATAASGEFSEATSLDDLSQIYDQLGTRLAHEYLVAYRSFQSLGSKVHVSVKVSGIAGTATAGYAAPSIPPPVATGYHSGFGGSFWTSPFTMIVFSILVVGLVAFCVFVLLAPRQRSLRKRLAEFVSLAKPVERRSVGSAFSSSVVDTTQKSLQGRKWWARFREEVEIAEIEMNPVHILFWTALVTVALMWVFAVFFTFAAALLGLFVPVAVWGFIRRAAERKRAAFGDQLPDNLAVLASALRAGHSLVGALSVVVEDAPEPARSEFRRVVADEQLGRPLDEALEVVAHRMKNTDLRQVALVASLQRETGGSTSEVLDRVVETVRERQELRRLVKTLTAAGRMSRWVVTFLPVGLIAGIALLNPGYLKPLFTHTSGRILFVLAALLVIGGSMVIKRIVDIKV